LKEPPLQTIDQKMYLFEWNRTIFLHDVRVLWSFSW